MRRSWDGQSVVTGRVIANGHRECGGVKMNIPESFRGSETRRRGARSNRCGGKRGSVGGANGAADPSPSMGLGGEEREGGASGRW